MSSLRARLRKEPLQVSDGLAAALLESLADPVLACDAEGTIVLANQSARTILGFPGDPVPPEEWTVRCPIYRPDGTQVTRTEELPLATVKKLPPNTRRCRRSADSWAGF